MAIATRLLDTDNVAQSLQSRFLTLLPRIERQARMASRQLRCGHRRADFIAEVTALAWKWFVRLIQRGKDATRFVSAIAIYATRAVRSGRRFVGKEKLNDVLSPHAQNRHDFMVCSLPQRSLASETVFAEALTDNTVTPVPDQVAFRQDFPRWRRRWSPRDRQLIRALLSGERAIDVANKFGLSAARVSQKRREFYHDWSTFCQ